MPLILPIAIAMSVKILFLLLITPTLYALPEKLQTPNGSSFYVIDGDSLSLQMRIYGIDTPEIGQICQDSPNIDIDCGAQAKQQLAQLLMHKNQTITVKPIAFDKYKRLLVSVFRGETDIAQMMVASGFAFAYGKKYRQQEQAAKAKKLGFWAYHQMPIKPKNWRLKNKR